jgi:alpha-beta hydrolase superfamily lysophospholipase
MPHAMPEATTSTLVMHGTADTLVDNSGGHRAQN